MPVGIPEQRSPGEWRVRKVRCQFSDDLRAVHRVPVREDALGLHVIDVHGSCCCEPEDEKLENRHHIPVWRHREFTTLT